MLSRRLRAVAALGALGLAGCYVYVPADLQTVAAGEDVRLRVSREAAAALSEIVPEGAPLVRGTLVRRDPEELFVRVPIAVRRQGLATRPIAQEVGISRSQILEVELRRKSGTRTALFVAGTTAVAGVVVGLIVVEGRDRVIRDAGPPDEMRRPLAF